MSRRLRAFKRWMASHSIVYSDALEFVDSPDDGISVRALCDLKEGDLIATIPKLSCLTIRTSGVSSLVEVSGLDGCTDLALALMYERSLGAASPWEGYLQLLLDRECVPLTWSSVEVDKLLVGTELHKMVKEDEKLLFEDWKEYIEPIIQSGNLEIKRDYFGIEQYFSAKSLIASRSFAIDEYHGSGMVPLADLFNHKTGAENVHFTVSSSSSSSEDGSDVDNFEPSDDDEKSPAKSFTDISESELTGTLEMIVVKEVEAGSEVFNTYGCLGNAALLHRYGFTEPENPFDTVNIELAQVLRWCSSAFSDRHFRARLSSWRKLNYSGCAGHGDSELFEITSSGEPQLDLVTLLHIVFLSESMFQNLNCALDSLTRVTEADKLTKLAEMTKLEFSEHKPEGLKELFLSDGVCRALIGVANIRESLYGGGSLKGDIRRLQNCYRFRERKAYHSLVLRLGERKILGKLRLYARKRLKRSRKRKRWTKS